MSIQAYVQLKRCSTFTLYLFGCDTSDGEDKGMHDEDDGSNLVVLRLS